MNAPHFAHARVEVYIEGRLHHIVPCPNAATAVVRARLRNRFYALTERPARALAVFS